MKHLSLGAALAAALVILGAWLPLVAQEGETGEEAQEKAPWVAADLPPSAYVGPGPAPDPVSRVYSKRLSKVWKKLVRLLEKEGLELSALDKDSGSIQTELKIFDEVKGPFRNVGTYPPKATMKRPIRQWVQLNRGRYALDITVESEEGTRVTIGVYLEERAFHIGGDVRIWVQRYSNGTVEKYFLDKLEEAL